MDYRYEKIFLRTEIETSTDKYRQVQKSTEKYRQVFSHI